MKMMGDVVAVPAEEGSCNSGSSPSTSSAKESRTLRKLKKGLGRLWRRHRGNVSITEYDPSYKVAYLGNVLTGWAKGEGCVEKPVATLWRNYVGSSRPDVSMRLTVTSGGLTATTRDHGLTEYWAHRVTYCTAPVSHPRLVVWVYRHEGRRLRPELRCHAALCSTETRARRLATTLNARLQQALMEFRRDKVSRQNARLSLANAVYENPSLPRRKILLSTGGHNYRPPLERSKSAPKLSAIEEDAVAEELEQKRVLEELRSLENVARSWQEQDQWRLARLVDALNRGNSGESSDENGSISSGCETASTANSEERAPGTEDQNPISDCEPRSPRRVYFSDEAILLGPSPRRNSEGSPNFMTCTGSPKFLNCSERQVYPGNNDYPDNTGNVFDFEDADDFAEEDVVDCRPRGENPGRLDGMQERREQMTRSGNYSLPSGQADLREEDKFLTLDSLDEEADSDESGYVEAPPKTLSKKNDEKVHPSEYDRNGLNNSNFSEKPQKENLSDQMDDDIYEDSDVTMLSEKQHNDENQRLTCEKEDLRKLSTSDELKSIKCPISETIKKLANASLKTSKSLELSTNRTCLKALNSLKSSKSFDNTTTLDVNDESPSLHQRKQLLAQQGVKV